MSKTAIESQFQQYEKFTYNKHPCEFDNGNDNEYDIVSVFQYCELKTILGGSAHLEGSNSENSDFPHALRYYSYSVNSNICMCTDGVMLTHICVSLYICRFSTLLAEKQSLDTIT